MVESFPASVHSRGHNSRTRGLGRIFLELSRALRLYRQTNACLFLRRAMNSPTVFDLIFRFLCFEAGSHTAQATMEPNGAKVSLLPSASVSQVLGLQALHILHIPTAFCLYKLFFNKNCTNIPLKKRFFSPPTYLRNSICLVSRMYFGGQLLFFPSIPGEHLSFHLTTGKNQRD